MHLTIYANTRLDNYVRELESLGMILALVSLKGGVGKTTSAMHLAAVMAADGGEVVVVDADDEQSALRWAAYADSLPFRVVPAERDGLAQQVRREHGTGALIVVDTPPNSRELLTRASMVATHVIVPVLPTGLDIDRMMPTLRLLRDTQATKDGLDVGILLTHWDKRKSLAGEASAALDEYPVFDAKIRDLTRYEQAFGTTPSYLAEYAQVYRELRNG